MRKKYSLALIHPTERRKPKVEARALIGGFSLFYFSIDHHHHILSQTMFSFKPSGFLMPAMQTLPHIEIVRGKRTVNILKIQQQKISWLISFHLGIEFLKRGKKKSISTNLKVYAFFFWRKKERMNKEEEKTAGESGTSHIYTCYVLLSTFFRFWFIERTNKKN